MHGDREVRVLQQVLLGSARLLIDDDRQLVQPLAQLRQRHLELSAAQELRFIAHAAFQFFASDRDLFQDPGRRGSYQDGAPIDPFQILAHGGSADGVVVQQVLPRKVETDGRSRFYVHHHGTGVAAQRRAVVREEETVIDPCDLPRGQALHVEDVGEDAGLVGGSVARILGRVADHRDGLLLPEVAVEERDRRRQRALSGPEPDKGQVRLVFFQFGDEEDLRDVGFEGDGLQVFLFEVNPHPVRLADRVATDVPPVPTPPGERHRHVAVGHRDVFGDHPGRAEVGRN